LSDRFVKILVEQERLSQRRLNIKRGLSRTYQGRGGHHSAAIGRRLGKNRPYVSTRVRLLKLHPTPREAVRRRKLTPDHAQALLRLEDPEQQLAGSKGYYPPGEWLAFDDKGYVINWPLPSTAGGVIKGLNGEVYDEMVFHRWGEEYGIIKVYDKKKEIKIGDLLEIIPYHCCSTVNLYDELFGVRNDEVEARWPIWARGKVR